MSELKKQVEALLIKAIAYREEGDDLDYIRDSGQISGIQEVQNLDVYKNPFKEVYEILDAMLVEAEKRRSEAEVRPGLVLVNNLEVGLIKLIKAKIQELEE